MIPMLVYIRKKNQSSSHLVSPVSVVEVKDPGMRIKPVFLNLIPHCLGLEWPYKELVPVVFFGAM